MTFSTRNNPRLAQSGVALTSLGAVGGARGTAAGSLRIFVEFLTTYDKEAIKELEGDINEVDRKSRFAAAEDEHRIRKLQAVKTQLSHVDANLRNRADAATRKEIRIQDSLQGVRTKAGKADLATSKQRLNTLLTAQGFTKTEIADINNRYNLKKKIVRVEEQTASAEQRAIARTKARTVAEGQLSKIQQVRATFGPKLAGLAIGALGGIVGGAILGVGFQLAQTAIEKVGDAIQDLIDPARHAREAVADLAKQVNDLASDKNISKIKAAQEIVRGFGITPTTQQGGQLAALLAENAIRQQIIEALKTEASLLDVLRNRQQLDIDFRKEVARVIRDEAKAEGTYRTERVASGKSIPYATTKLNEFVGTLTLEEAVTRRIAGLTGDLTTANDDLANATARAAQAASDASALWNVYSQSLSDAIQTAVGLQTAPIDKQLDALGTGISKRTRQLERAVERASGGGGGTNNRQQLQNIAEERALLLLKMRLKLLGTNINLEKFSGKFLLVAINAKIAALQKEGEEQSRLNQLLDVQYRLSQQTLRQQGESINSFIQRKAQEQRSLLAERDDLERQNRITQLEARKDNLEDQLSLEELAERRRETLRQSSTSSHLNNLRKQLEASKEADRKALAAKKDALEKQKKALEDAAKDAIQLTSDTAQQETYAAIRGMRTLEDISKFSGRLSGLLRAKNAIQALVDGFGLPKSIAAPFLDKLNAMIEAASGRIEGMRLNLLPRRGGIPFAKGGVFSLNNANSPFGANVRTGEEGTEIGVILSNKVAKILKQNQMPGQVGPFIIQQSDDPLRDAYRFGKLVRENVEAALG